MFDGVPSMDSVFLPLKELAREPNNPLRQPIRSFLKKVNALLASRKNLPENAAAFRDEQFALRIRALQWIISEEVDLNARYSELDARLRQMEEEEGNALPTNMRFALHTQIEVMQAIAGPKLDLSLLDRSPLDGLGDLGFTQFESALMIGIPNQQAAHVLLCWLHASMDLEVALLMGDAVLNEEVTVSPTRIDALNRFLINAAQTYAGSARLLGVVRATDAPMTIAAEPLPTSWVKGQKRLADEGLGDWLRL